MGKHNEGKSRLEKKGGGGGGGKIHAASSSFFCLEAHLGLVDPL